MKVIWKEIDSSRAPQFGDALSYFSITTCISIILKYLKKRRKKIFKTFPLAFCLHSKSRLKTQVQGSRVQKFKVASASNLKLET